ncbi:MAG: WD40 repeat domain-containing protein [Rubripirellula sp.]|nr:WD40 repeat domain-containing protein [Rubripirellula sp.]
MAYTMALLTLTAQEANPFPIANHAVWTQHDDAVYGLVFAPDGTGLASGSYDKTIKHWNSSNGDVIATFRGHRDQVFRIGWSPDGKSLLSCSGDGSAIQWNLAQGKAEVTLTGHGDPMMSASYSPDGNLIATAGFHIQLWRQGETQWSTPHSQPFFSVAFSPDQKTLACGTENHVRFLDTKSGATLPPEIPVTGMVYQVDYSPDGKWLAIASGDQVAVWDLVHHKMHKTIEADVSALFAATFSANGEFLLTGGRERVVRVWSVPDLKLRGELYGPAETILSIAISPDGRQVAAGTYDGTIHLWSRSDL